MPVYGIEVVSLDGPGHPFGLLRVRVRFQRRVEDVHLPPSEQVGVVHHLKNKGRFLSDVA